MLPRIGTLSTSSKTLYTVPEKKIGVIDNIGLVNEAGAQASVYLYLVIGNITIALMSEPLTMDNKDYGFDARKRRLPQGAYITGYANLSGVYYEINGIEEHDPVQL